MKTMANNESGSLSQGKALPTSGSQREILASVALGDDASCAFNMCMQVDFQGRLDTVALNHAVTALGQRHQLLRARFSADGETMQIDSASDVELQVVDLTLKSPEETSFAVEQVRQREVSEAFDLVSRHAWRIHFLLLDDNTSCIIFTAHHVIVDGWSLAVLRENLESLYNASMENKEPDLESAIPFDQYLRYLSEQQESGARDASRDYWVEQFSSGEPVVDFPLDYARPPQRTYAADRCDVKIPREVADRLRQMAREQNNSLFNVLFSAFYSYLYRSSGAEDLVVGIPAAGHSVAGLYEMIGHCVNILPVRQQLAGTHSYADLLQSTRSKMLDAQDNQGFTFSELMGCLDLQRDASRIPIVSMLFNIDQDPGTHNFAGIPGQANIVPHRYENFEVFCNILDRKGELTVEWAYNSQLFSAEATEHRVHSFVALLTQIANAPRLLLDDLSLLSSLDQEIYNKVNNTHQDMAPNATVLSLLEDALASHGDSDALVAGGTRLSYVELHQQSNQLANYLHSTGVSKGDWVALCLQRSEQMVVAIIALMKIGATYVPLDPAYPADRVAYIIDNANASVIISQSNLVESLPAHQGSNICLDLIKSKLEQQSKEAPVSVSLSSDDLIYAIYTSGSTGNPKGVKLKHVNVTNFLISMARKPGLTSSDRLVAVTTLSFDIAVLELMLPLTVGACVIVATRDQATDGDALQALMSAEKANVLQATPATWRMLIQAGWKGQQNLKALVGGEALPRDLAMQLASCTSELWNMYGPTETAIWSTCEQVVPAASSIYIGKPIDNTKIYLLDERGHPAPVGLPAELLIGGTGVCAGYHLRDDLNDAVFIQDIFSRDIKAKLYRTRDRVKLHPDGRLEYLERMDNQVKVRGYRIELGEIETVLGEQPGVEDCAVLAREDNPGDVRLVAYVCSVDGKMRERDLSLGLRQRLPEFMQPQHFVLIADMPRTPNGKLDRKALPPPVAREDSDQPDKILARTATERWVAERWTGLIDNKNIGVDDNFFALGGHSLLAMRFIAESRKAFSGSISLRMLLSDSLAQVAVTLEPNDKPVVEPDVITGASLKKSSPLDIYFARSLDQTFFCAYHAPANEAKPQRAVLLVQSLGHEYQRGHRAMQEIATALSKAGCAVLRFDYRNTGDSPGESDQLKLSQLQQDLVAATDELCAKSGCQEVELLSLRVGALLACSVADSRWSKHFAWDPVLDGADHYQLLQKLHFDSLNDLDRYISPRSVDESEQDELVGYSYPPEFVKEISALNKTCVSNLELLLSTGESSFTGEKVTRLQLTPDWQDRDHTETHLQMPADLELLVKTITGDAP